jgi:hypothetical protein
VSRMSPTGGDFSDELDALGSVLQALKPLDEQARAFVVRTAAERLQISGFVIHGNGPKPPPMPGPGPGIPPNGVIAGQTPKEFLAAKRPATELQRIACLGFYLTHAQQKPHFKTADLTALNTDAAEGKLSNPSATVRNATTQSHFFAPAGKAGLKQVTTLCEAYVHALPDQEAAKAAISAHRPAPRTGTKKKRKPSKKE